MREIMFFSGAIANVGFLVRSANLGNSTVHQQDNDSKLEQLRKQVQAKIDKEDPGVEVCTPERMLAILYDLRTHQIELEMQNDELRLAQLALIEARDRYVDLYDFAPIGYLTINPQGLILESNLTFANMLGLARANLVKQPFSNVIGDEAQDDYYRYIVKLKNTQQKQTCELPMILYQTPSTRELTSNRSLSEPTNRFWARLDGRVLVDGNDVVLTINLSVSDITPFKQAKDQLEQLAAHDPLTRLPNRYSLENELSQRVKLARRFQQRLAILFIDIDQFKVINDTMGHQHGDKLLKIVAKRLSAHLRDYDCVYRFGGDEFVLIMQQVRHSTEVVSLADKVLNEFSKECTIQRQDFYITISIGISLYPQDGKSSSELLQNADAAMYRAKEAGGGRYSFYTHALNNELRRYQKITSELRISLNHQYFQLYYQPQVDINSGKIKCCEALIRLRSATGNPISPKEFIPIAEKSKLIYQIGDWVLNEACRQRAEWKRQGLLDLRIDINLSGREILQYNFFSMLDRVLMQYQLNASDIGIELTENVLIQTDEKNLSNIRRLNRAGMRISIDDFGTGYSSLSYLRRFPVHNLKIDQEFIRDAPQNKEGRSIMEAIVAVGHRLGLTVVVEGVETLEQHRLAQEIECDLGQGYYFHKPMTANELFSLVTKAPPT